MKFKKKDLPVSLSLRILSCFSKAVWRFPLNNEITFVNMIGWMERITNFSQFFWPRKRYLKNENRF